MNQLGQGQNQRQNQHRRHHRDPFGGHTGDAYRGGDARNLRVHLGQSAGNIGSQVLKQVAHADGGDHDAHPGSLPQGLVGRPLNDKAQKHRQYQHQRHGHCQRNAGGEIDHHQARHHEHVSVGEVDQAQDAIDHGIANGDQGVLSAQGHAGEQDGNGVLHEGTLPCRFVVGNARGYGTIPKEAAARKPFSGRSRETPTPVGGGSPDRPTDLSPGISVLIWRSGRSPGSRPRRRCPPF